jgi:hypothetical protein
MSGHSFSQLFSPPIYTISIKCILLFSFHSLLGLSGRCFPENFPTKISNVFLGKEYCSTETFDSDSSETI